jgi:hypothetical protein
MIIKCPKFQRKRTPGEEFLSGILGLEVLTWDFLLKKSV